MKHYKTLRYPWRRRVLAVVTTCCPALAGAGLWAGSAQASPGTAGPCDFNGDGYDDLAVAVPGENINGDDAAGAINVIYGGSGGLSSSFDQVFHQDSTDVDGAAEEGDSFGSALACADFNDDGWDDLAIGVANENLGSTRDNAGLVNIIFGTPFGLNATLIADQTLTLDDLTGLAAASGDSFGAALAADDFDGDGHADLAVGIPGYDVSGLHNAGAIAVVFGQGSGLATAGAQLIHQDTPGFVDAGSTRDRYGDVLATGDFDDDGYADLVVGAPLDNYHQGLADQVGNSGMVHVIYGSVSGLSSSGDQRILPGTPEVHGMFGAAVTTGDFDNDGYADLAVGTPGTWVGGHEQAGSVTMVYGSNGGLDLGDWQYFSQAGAIAGVPEKNDRFGQALASGDFDDDGIVDLAIGAPGEAVGEELHAGLVHVLLGTGSGLTTAGNTSWHQDTPNISGVAMAGDTFGRTLSAGDYDADGNLDLAVGVPGDIYSGMTAPGTVHVLEGSGQVFNTATDERWHQDRSGIDGAGEPNDMFGGIESSTGVYRVPYANGTTVKVSGDVYSHTRRFDIDGQNESAYTIVAAADGIVRFVDDSNAEPTSVNNAVWIEHPNGEWTKYSHMRTGTVPPGVLVGATIDAGDELGIEGDVGYATGEHLHFHVLALDDPDSGVREGNYRYPRFCGVPGGMLHADETYVADDC